MSGRPSIPQLEALVEFLEQNVRIAKGQLRTAHAKQETKRKWASLANTLNAIGGANKDGAGWAKYWAEKKCALKKHCSTHAASTRRTGGGLDNLPPLPPLDLRLVEVMGGYDFAVRDSELAVEPFPQSISQMATPAPSGGTEEPFILQNQRSPKHQPQPEGPQPIPTPTQPEPVKSPRRSLLRSPRRPRRVVRPSPMSQELDRMTRLEERRVAAETVTAQAFADATARLDRCAAALEQLSEAVREGATSIEIRNLEIAKRGTPPT